LHIGTLAVVQPLLLSSLVFAIAFNHRLFATRVRRHELRWALVLVAALAGFLAFARVSSSSGTPVASADIAPAITIGAVGAVTAMVLVLRVRRRSGPHAAAILGTIVGVTYAATAALIKACSDIGAHRPLQLAVSWQTYVLIALGATGLILNQLAFQAGPLTASLPATATVDPLLSVVLGVFVYDEQLHHSPVDIAGELVCFILLCLAAVRLTKGERPDQST
jgi:drug/metabolite transporter (DMT)-like permease